MERPPPSSCPAIAGYVPLPVRALGSGQFGDVFLVRRIRDARVFAAKIPRVGSDADVKEALLLQRLSHPNVIKCEELVRVDAGRRLAIVMEYAAMGDLEEYIRGFAQRNEAVPESEVMRIFLQIALALAYLHDQRVLHRDLKPKNILLDAHGIVKLSDFGVSRSLQHTLDAAQTITGTPYYMSPELMDNQPYDAKADVWSLGCILIELATHAPPFPAKALAALVMQIVSHQPPPIPTTYSPEMNLLVKKLLIKDPSKRLSIREVLAEPFVQQHLFRLATTVPMNLAADGCNSCVQHMTNPPPPPPLPHAELTPVPRPQSAVLCNAPFRNDFVADPNHAAPAPSSGEVELRRRVFLENQAAAQRNKDRVALEKASPPVFLNHEDPEKYAEQPRSGSARVQLARVDDTEAARERTKQCYLENARAAKLNKQRAIEAMKGQAETILLGSCDPVEDARADPMVVSPPPAPPTRPNKTYEALLEGERRRVRLERKLLHDRMREEQLNGLMELAPSESPVMASTDVPT